MTGENSEQERVLYLQSLKAIREQCDKVFNLVKMGKSKNWSLNLDKMKDVVGFVEQLINRDYADLNDIPPHSRWRHMEYDGEKRVWDLLDEFNGESISKDEQVRRIIDLFIVSVLLDAGAGPQWKYTTGESTHSRSEGLAIAVFDMFVNGEFSSKGLQKVDAVALGNITLERLQKGFQYSENDNRLEGINGRLQLLNKLSLALESHPEFFRLEPEKPARPGYLYDYLIKTSTKLDYQNRHIVHINSLWNVIINGLKSVWPETRTKVDNISLGDVWECSLIKDDPLSTETLVPFHKLSQWIAYSLIEPLETLGGIVFEHKNLLTGLPEYRNGGLFVDLGVLELKSDLKDRYLEVNDQIIVEWRALTVSLIDIVAEKLFERFNSNASAFSLPKVLEGGTWKAGREIAAKLRPASKDPPIRIISDGTVF